MQTTDSFTVPCTHHGQHTWMWADLPGHWGKQRQKNTRADAAYQLRTICPSPGNLLTLDDLGFCVRKSKDWVDEDEVIVAIPTY